MAITDKNTLKSWFKRGLKPLESQFHAWMDSYWHKEEKIRTSDIDGLEDTLNNKAEVSVLENLEEAFGQHAGDTILHKTTEEQYKLAHLANNPDETYVTQEQLQDLAENSAIVIPVDFSMPNEDIIQNIEDFVIPLFEDGTIFTKPLYLLYSWKEDYVTEGAPEYKRLVPQTSMETIFLPSGKEKTTFKFNSPIGVMMAGVPGLRYAWCFMIQRLGSTVSADVESYWEECPVEVVCAYDNGDGIFDAADGNYNRTARSGWENLYTELNKGNRPMLFLKTPDSEMYCPASYEFTGLAADVAATKYTGKVQISYVRETDRGAELWVETRKISNLYGFIGSYDYPYLKKYPLDTQENTLVLSNLDMNGKWYERESVKLKLINQFKTFKNVKNPVTFKIYDEVNDQSMLCIAKMTAYELIFTDPDNYEVSYTIEWPHENFSVNRGDRTTFYFSVTNGEVTVSIENKIFPELHTIYLMEDGNGMVNSLDQWMMNNWGIWGELLRVGQQPAVFLKTDLSGGYVPVYYTCNANETDGYHVDMKISYIQETEGQTELCIERRYFKGIPYNGSAYYPDATAEIAGVGIKKIVL